MPPINTPDSTPPPPKIGKIGPYTVFITPPATPNSNSKGLSSPKPDSPRKPVTMVAPPSPAVQAPKTPPVQAPPMQMPKSAAKSAAPSSNFGFFWDAVAKVQTAHETLDERVAHWFGLNQSKYQWALDDYYESKGINQKDAEAKMANKV